MDDTIRALLDKDAIRDLIHAYCDHFDKAEAAEVAALFTEDAVVDYGPEVAPLHGRTAILAQIEGGLAEFFAASSHHVSNVRIAFDGPDRASSVCYLYAWHIYRESGAEGELWGRYHHDLVRTADGWRFARLELRGAGTRNFHRARMHPIGRRGG
ncbi:nuclear transport factor 2 family protein [Rhodobacteraceae bacterium CCMM004]|nr:nuclear transport factor 2 family protein [Rhodobacteraceae bacterium CCMM004]